jgi:hypothetical protein
MPFSLPFIDLVPALRNPYQSQPKAQSIDERSVHSFEEVWPLLALPKIDRPLNLPIRPPIKKSMRTFFAPSRSSLRSAGRLTLRAFLFTAFVSATLHATPITYNLMLTPGADSLYGGTGSITVEAAPAASGIPDYTISSGNLKDLTFTLDNQSFTLDGASGNTLVRFLNGQLKDITFAETVGASPARFTLDSTSSYAFYFDNGQSASYGSITASPVESPVVKTAQTSEPASLALFGTGLLFSIGLLYRTNSPRFGTEIDQPQD